MSDEAVILFLSHGDNPTARKHLELVRSLNPGTEVIPIHQRSANPLPGSLDVGTDPQFESERSKNWLHVDNLIYQWYRQSGGGPKRYVVVEWDTLCEVPVRDFYADLWDSEAVASIRVTPEQCPSWHWFQPAQFNLPTRLIPYAAGILPTSMLLFSDAALRAIATSDVMPIGTQSELRLGTLLAYHGFTVDTLPVPKQRGIQCNASAVTWGDEPGIYHPVKAITGRPPPATVDPWADWLRVPESYRDIYGQSDLEALYARIVNDAPPGSRLVEVGCLMGRSVCLLGTLAKTANKDLSVVAVDRCRGTITDTVGVDFAERCGGSYAGVLARNIAVCGLDDTVTLVVQDSVRAARLFADGSLQFVYLDGDHSFDGLSADLAAWWPKVRPGGVMAGHDYHHPAYRDAVQSAVAAFFGPGDRTDPDAGCSWSIAKT